MDDSSRMADSAFQKEMAIQNGDSSDAPDTGSLDAPVDIEKNAVKQEAAADKLDWDGPGDPENPLNWPAYKRRMQVVCIALFTLIANLAATMFAPGVEKLAQEFGITDSTISSMTVSIYILGFAFGPLLLAPLSELYGRLPVYAGSGVVYIAFLFGSAFATDVGMFIAFRLLCGGAGASSMALSGGTLADVIPPEHRGRWMGLFVLGPLMGPVIGPIAGGFIAQSIGWRWVFRVLLIACGFVGVLCIIFLRETYGPAILRQRAARRLKAQGINASAAMYRKESTASRLARSITRPLRLLFLSPIVLFLSLYAAFAFGLLFLLFTSFAVVFKEQYGWSTGLSGLAYLGLGIGMFLGVAAQSRFSDSYMKSRAVKRGGEVKPEDRLMLMAYLAPALPAGMFWYGWSVDKQTHWIVPILGSVLIGVGVVFVMMPQMIYLVDIYGAQAGASALSANMVLRCITGAFLPLAGPAMYQTLHLGWGNSLLAFLGIAFIPVPWVLAIYGEKIRLSRKVDL